MAGYANNREQNYEVKYLRKVLGEVDERIKVPESVHGAALRHLLDDVPSPAAPKQKEAALQPEPRRVNRRRWLSLQSGIAYAAAFALIVALFYSLEYSKPNIIEGSMSAASQPTQSEQPGVTEQAQNPTQDDKPGAASGAAAENTEGAQTAESAQDASGDTAPESETLSAVGGSNQATLLLEQDTIAYYARANDASDPDKEGFPVTLEVVDRGAQEIISQVNIPDMTFLDHCFVSDGFMLLLGPGADGGYLARTYRSVLAGEFTEDQVYPLPGQLVDARVYKETAHIVTMAPTAPAEGAAFETLPNTQAEDTCTFAAVDLMTGETTQFSFVGAKGTVQLHNLNAYIHYEGTDEDGNERDYIAQITLDGTHIELTAVS